MGAFVRPIDAFQTDVDAFHAASVAFHAASALDRRIEEERKHFEEVLAPSSDLLDFSTHPHTQPSVPLQICTDQQSVAPWSRPENEDLRSLALPSVVPSVAPASSLTTLPPADVNCTPINGREYLTLRGISSSILINLTQDFNSPEGRTFVEQCKRLRNRDCFAPSNKDVPVGTLAPEDKPHAWALWELIEGRVNPNTEAHSIMTMFEEEFGRNAYRLIEEFEFFSASAVAPPPPMPSQPVVDQSDSLPRPHPANVANNIVVDDFPDLAAVSSATELIELSFGDAEASLFLDDLDVDFGEGSSTGSLSKSKYPSVDLLSKFDPFAPAFPSH